MFLNLYELINVLEPRGFDFTFSLKGGDQCFCMCVCYFFVIDVFVKYTVHICTQDSYPKYQNASNSISPFKTFRHFTRTFSFLEKFTKMQPAKNQNNYDNAIKN
eukprot:TRINITY_DN6373_c0_g1_i10.p2 TRINITY_DN6373_c0_g1~~TRINITY_DN6373_c0_g1_i10.p2  ORF type:complete len:104 (-),score=6.20 TRINITY_DN6373_c0_g1_i10:44-355(-)